MAFLTKVFGLGGGLSGIKTIIGAALLVLSHQVGLAERLVAQYPAEPAFAIILTGIQAGLSGLQIVSELLGNGFLSVGVLHKLIKAVK